MTKTKRILVVNFIGLSILIFFAISVAISLMRSGVDPVTIIGSLMNICLFIYAAGFFIWNSVIYISYTRQNNYKPHHLRNATIILVVGVIVPFLFMLLFATIGVIAANKQGL